MEDRSVLSSRRSKGDVMQKKPAKRSTAATTVRPARKSARKPAAATTPASKNLLTAGIQALSNAHQEAIVRQRGVFESLLGLGGRRDAETGRGKESGPSPNVLDPFGIRKFEDVFDQRVARAMERLALPTGETIAELKAEIERLQARVAALETAGTKR
jgi:hypothetical protein